MRHDRGALGWGIFFITVGAVALAVQAGVVDRDVLRQLWRLWPLLLVGAGISIILRATRFALVGGLLMALVFGLIGGMALAGGFGDLGSICGPGKNSAPTFARSGTFGPSAGIDLEVPCGDVTVRSVAEPGWTLSGVAAAGREPVVSSAADRLSIQSGRADWFLAFADAGERWHLTLPQITVISLSSTVDAGIGTFDLRSGRFGTIDTTLNAGTLHIDLDGSTVNTIGLTVNAGDAHLVLPDASLTGSFTVNAGSVRFCVPSATGLRITMNETLASNDFAGAGLTKDGSTWTSPNYGSAAHRIDLSATANAGTISLNPKDGCA